MFFDSFNFFYKKSHGQVQHVDDNADFMEEWFFNDDIIDQIYLHHHKSLLVSYVLIIRINGDKYLNDTYVFFLFQSIAS